MIIGAPATAKRQLYLMDTCLFSIWTVAIRSAVLTRASSGRMRELPDCVDPQAPYTSFGHSLFLREPRHSHSIKKLPRARVFLAALRRFPIAFAICPSCQCFSRIGAYSRGLPRLKDESAVRGCARRSFMFRLIPCPRGLRS
jgi:hypothetical protein